MQQESLKVDSLAQAKAVIIDLEAALEEKNKGWLEVRQDNPEFEQVNEENCREKTSNFLLHGATDIFESNELSTWLHISLPLSKLAQTKASKHIEAWEMVMESKGPWGHYYADDPRFFIKSEKNETLLNFIIQMAVKTEIFGKGDRIEWRALKSFLGYLRGTYPKEEVAFIEQIFPSDMDVFYNRIIRKIPREVYPIPLQVAGDIIQGFMTLCKDSRPNAQHSFVEALGLCWLCLTASRLRLPIELEAIYQTKSSAISFEDEFPTILIPTFFGNQKIRISWRIAKFLSHLSEISSNQPRDTILQKPLRSLTRAFDRVLEHVRPDSSFGNITFLTLISPPHVFGEDHRFIPK